MQPEDLSKVVHVKIPPQYLQHGVQTEGKKQPAGTYGTNEHLLLIYVHTYRNQMFDANPPKNSRIQTEDLNTFKLLDVSLQHHSHS